MGQRDVTLAAGDLYRGEKSMCDGYTMNKTYRVATDGFGE